MCIVMVLQYCCRSIRGQRRPTANMQLLVTSDSWRRQCSFVSTSWLVSMRVAHMMSSAGTEKSVMMACSSLHPAARRRPRTQGVRRRQQTCMQLPIPSAAWTQTMSSQSCNQPRRNAVLSGCLSAYQSTSVPIHASAAGTRRSTGKCVQQRFTLTNRSRGESDDR